MPTAPLTLVAHLVGTIEVIAHAVWLYFCFPLSYRNVEELLAERGVIVSYETIRQWCRKFGQAYANGLRRRQPRPGDKWHLDEVFMRINGETQYLWRAVDQHGAVLDVLVQRRRNTRAARRFFRKLQAAQGLTVRAAGADHRQAGELRGGQARGAAERGSPRHSLSDTCLQSAMAGKWAFTPAAHER